MKATWQVRRTVVEQPDGQRRWDTAYQFLLHWALEPTAGPQPTGSPNQENDYGDCTLRTRIDQPPNANPKH